MITLHHGDCLDILPTLEAGSVDMVLADPPYGQTACAWDSVIDLPSMWQELKRVIKPNGAIVLFGSDPFTSVLITGNLSMFKYRWVWEKSFGTNFLNVTKQPLRTHEDVVVFYDLQPTFNPQMSPVAPRTIRRRNGGDTTVYGKFDRFSTSNSGLGYPRSVLYFSKANINGTFHPTQKPIALLQYLIRTYTQKEDTVLDFCMGSGSTGVACIEERRSFIGIEKDAGYFEIAQKRIHEAETAPRTMRMELTA